MSFRTQELRTSSLKGLVRNFQQMSSNSEFITTRNRVVTNTSSRHSGLNDTMVFLLLRCGDYSSQQPISPPTLCHPYTTLHSQSTLPTTYDKESPKSQPLSPRRVSVSPHCDEAGNNIFIPFSMSFNLNIQFINFIPF